MKKSTGLTRRLDPLGRIVIPIELRRTLNIEEGNSLEIFTDGDNIVLRKYQPGCFICDSLKDVHTVDGVKICKSCAEKIAKVIK